MAERVVVLKVESITVEAKAYRTDEWRTGVGAEKQLHSNGHVVYVFAPESAPFITVKVEVDVEGNIVLADLTRKLAAMAHEGVNVACASAQIEALEAEREKERREKEAKEKKDAEITAKVHKDLAKEQDEGI